MLSTYALNIQIPAFRNSKVSELKEMLNVLSALAWKRKGDADVACIARHTAVCCQSLDNTSFICCATDVGEIYAQLSTLGGAADAVIDLFRKHTVLSSPCLFLICHKCH